MVKQIISFSVVMSMVFSSAAQVPGIQPPPGFQPIQPLFQPTGQKPTEPPANSFGLGNLGSIGDLSLDVLKLCKLNGDSDLYRSMVQQNKPQASAQVAQNVDVTVRSAMSRVYSRTHSSAKAQAAVADVLEKHGCDSSVPEQIEYSEWIGKSETDMAMEQLLSKSSMPSSEGLGNGNPLQTAAPSAAESRWQNIGFKGDCAKARTTLAGVCSGEINPQKMMSEASSSGITYEDQVSLGWVGLGVMIAGGTLAYNMYQDHKKQETAAQNATLMRENRELTERNQEYQTQIKELKEELKPRPGGFGEFVPQISPEEAQSNRDAIAQREQAIKENKEKIAENTEVINATNANYEPPKPDKPSDDDNDLRDPVERYNQFVEYSWKPFQTQLVVQYEKACGVRTDDELTLHQPSEQPEAFVKETCNMGAAMAEVNELGRMGPSNDPYADLSQDMYAPIDNRVSNALMNMPVCREQPCSAAQMDRYYKSKGFEGGEAEFCAVSKLPSCATDKQLDEMTEGTNIIGNELTNNTYEKFLNSKKNMDSCLGSSDPAACVMSQSLGSGATVQPKQKDPLPQFNNHNSKPFKSSENFFESCKDSDDVIGCMREMKEAAQAQLVKRLQDNVVGQ